MKKYIMSLDLGTTSSRCIIFDDNATIISMEQEEYELYYSQLGWVEQDPKELLDKQINCAKKALEKSKLLPDDISCIGITNQRETTVVWDKKTGEPIYNAIVWQCTRGQSRIEQVKEDGMNQIIRDKTGLIPDSYFSATKIEWILDNVGGARERAERGELAFGTVDTWLIWNLTQDHLHLTDYTNASRTMLFNIKKLEWENELLDYFHIPSAMLPKVKASKASYGKTDRGIFGKEIPIAGVAGDQQAALFGHCCFDKGDTKTTYGTGCFLLMNTGDSFTVSKHGLLTSLSAGTEEGSPEYVLEGSVFTGGSVIKWLRDELKIIETSDETEDISESVESNSGVYFVPAFVGLGAPYWNRNIKASITGLAGGTGREHIVRAALESIAYQTYDVLEAMRSDFGEGIKELNVDGGASANNFLMQFQADILRVNAIRPKNVQVTALGAAFLAGLESGVWNNVSEIKKLMENSDVFKPKEDELITEEYIHGWHKAVNNLLENDN